VDHRRWRSSGRNNTHTGSKASGKKVEVKTGNNLSIESGIHLQRGITALRDIGKLQKI
jgi:hypothetical protein